MWSCVVCVVSGCSGNSGVGSDCVTGYSGRGKSWVVVVVVTVQYGCPPLSLSTKTFTALSTLPSGGGEGEVEVKISLLTGILNSR